MSITEIEKNRNSFESVAMLPQNPNWVTAIKRTQVEQEKENEIRSEFDRDYNRILHSLAYSRLKSKTQVFYHTHDDRICTRIEHVNHVVSVSSTISRFLGLNTELSYAIAMGHDLGHAPFGHKGENFLSELCTKHSLGEFWHEQNSLKVVDSLELLPTPEGLYKNLNLTYAVRDGIISHCGEANAKSIHPRAEAIDLSLFSKLRRFDPFTWEGCVVKISDKIAYLGRDLEDSQRLGILSQEQMLSLDKEVYRISGIHKANNTNLIHFFTTDICKNSSIEDGIKLSASAYELMTFLMKFNSANIYSHPRLKIYEEYARMILSSLFDVLHQAYKGKETLSCMQIDLQKAYPILHKDFSFWLENRTQESNCKEGLIVSGHHRIYKSEDEQDYMRAIIDFLSLLTDRAAIEYFGELTSF